MKKACSKMGVGVVIALLYQGAYAVDVYIVDPSHPNPGQLCSGFNDTATTEIYTVWFVGSVRCV